MSKGFSCVNAKRHFRFQSGTVLRPLLGIALTLRILYPHPTNTKCNVPFFLHRFSEQNTLLNICNNIYCILYWIFISTNHQHTSRGIPHVLNGQAHSL